MAEFRLTSSAFEHDEDLPVAFTAEGDDLSPPLSWEGVPDGARELVLVCEDPDADVGVFTHWIAYGIGPTVNALPQGLSRDAVIDEPVELVQGLNEFDEVGYSGPTNPGDRDRHRYFFRLFALDVVLDVPVGITRAELRAAAKGHVLATAELVAIA